MLKYQVISIHSADEKCIILDWFHMKYNIIANNIGKYNYPVI